MYSQNLEEGFLTAYFNDFVGRFLDIGAYDGVDFSNTKKLVEMGWAGVLVEPAPYYFRALLENYSGNSKLTLVHCALGATDRFQLFHSTERGGISTFDERWYSNWKDILGDYKDYFVPVISVVRFFEAFPGPYDFVSIDAEGMDREILEVLPLDGVKVVCVEHCGDEKRIAEFMRDAGFKILYYGPENYIFHR